MRVEHLRKPLEDLRFDVAALHDSMNASLHTIEDKLRHRAEVVGKRRLLEATLACLEKLDVAEEIVLQQVQSQGHGQGLGHVMSPKLSTGMRRRELLK